MAGTPKISVITVCYNSASSIRRTLESVIGQTYPNIEYIVIDGGSTDETMAIVNTYRKSIAAVISEPDKGLYDAMNKGLKLATGDWVHILNSDDYYPTPYTLGEAVPRLDPEKTNYFSMWREYEGGHRQLQNWVCRRWLLFISAFLPHPALIVSREQYAYAGCYDTDYRIAADHDLILRLTHRWPALKHDLPLTVMQQGGISGKNLRASMLEFRAVTEKQGLPKVLAGLILLMKQVWWGVRV